MSKMERLLLKSPSLVDKLGFIKGRMNYDIGAAKVQRQLREESHTLREGTTLAAQVGWHFSGGLRDAKTPGQIA